MCGIIGYAGNSEAVPVLIKGLKSLEYRGYDSAGIAVMDSDNLSIVKADGKIENLKNKIEKQKDITGMVGIGHTRWATHGEPSERNCHPHTDSDGLFTVVHNGIIENYDMIKEALMKKDFTFCSDTDTEVIPQLLSYFYEGNLLEALRKTLNVLNGSYALGIMCSDFPGKIVAAKKTSPLIVARGESENFLASDISAVLSYTNEYISLNDGEIAEISSEKIKLYDMQLKEKEVVFSKTSLDVSDVMKNGFEHFMLKEIYEQPERLRGLLENKISDKGVCLDELEKIKGKLKTCKKLYAVACGSAYHSAFAGTYVLEKLCKIDVEVDVASEFRYRHPNVTPETPVIVISQSGETADTIAALRLAKQKGADVIGIVNVLGSTVANECDCTLYTKAGPEIAVATTKGYTTQLAVFYLLSLFIASLRETLDENEINFYCNELKILPEKIEKQLSDTEKIESLASELYEKKNMFFIGRNTDYAAAMEASLKVKEISYINSEAYPSGELKHGTIALIEKGTPVISFCANGELLDKSLSNSQEVFARGAQVICVTGKNHSDRISGDYKCIFVEQSADMFTTMLEVVAMQLLSYHIAKKKNCDIDMPKNLAKSVTVE